MIAFILFCLLLCFVFGVRFVRGLFVFGAGIVALLVVLVGVAILFDGQGHRGETVGRALFPDVHPLQIAQQPPRNYTFEEAFERASPAPLAPGGPVSMTLQQYLDPEIGTAPISAFMFATGIECSNPIICNGTIRRDLLDECGQYERWQDDLQLVRDLGCRFLRYGLPNHIATLVPAPTIGPSPTPPCGACASWTSSQSWRQEAA